MDSPLPAQHSVPTPLSSCLARVALGLRPLQLASFGLLTGIACLVAGCDSEKSAQQQATSADTGQPTPTESLAERDTEFLARLGPTVKAFCGDCHAMPRPTSSPKGEWAMEIIQGFDLYQSSGRNDLVVPDQNDVERYFTLQASETIGLPIKSTLNYPPAKPTHEKTVVFRDRSRPAGVTNLQWMDLGFQSHPGKALVYCDIGTGSVNAYWPGTPAESIKRLATLLQPVHCEPCDIDQDDRIDLLVADIGEFNANDSDLGRVIWLRRSADDETFEKHVLIEGLSRTSDAQAGDFDSDGDVDVLVAAFGWRNSGRTFMLENQGFDDNQVPNFIAREIDPRHGPVHIPVVDIDGDGDLDFISLISQEHERVELFRNDGQGNFQSELIYAAPDPAYGSSGIELVDMDLDNDLDILYTNGDSFDRGPKPFHSVQWLENEGVFPMQHHQVCLMPGVLNATAGDFDSDGDIDVLAVALLASYRSKEWVSKGSSPIVMLTRENDGSFTPSRLEGRMHDHLSVVKGDFNNDSKLDFAIGNFFRPDPSDIPFVIKQPELLLWQSK